MISRRDCSMRGQRIFAFALLALCEGSIGVVGLCMT
jgi:hypothetical protein